MFFENSEELAQNKLLLLYIIDKSKKLLTNEQLTEFVLKEDYMNYFLVQQYLSELVSANFLEYADTKDKKVYHLLNKGKATLSYFENRISQSIKDNINDRFKQINKNEKKATQVSAEYFKKNNNEFVVNLKLIENTETLFSLYLNVATIKQAEKICEIWKDNTEYIYKNILNMLVDDEITSV
ncbi:DUF4364 family protein [Schnuerera sp. xch1]|uniref:DUF4364 family protein n=1 Tax=Schnuerera sp. xch1 TaxID=2874283 RepID=UPI001CBBEE3C|nr:DUF4364 family protein [Schnuerera sp. xch1]MBZ2175588.1 DUF4364 family protein [Schnuerera sp. xch1]